MGRSRSIAVMVLSFVLGGCAAPAPAPRHARPFPTRVALLPLSNLSLDVQAPELVRNLLDSYLAAATLAVLGPKEVDPKLREIGITEGGQLSAATPQRLGTLLESDGLLYGEIEEFKGVNVGVYVNRIVEIRLWVVEAATGETLWEETRRKADTQLRLSGQAVREKIAQDVLSHPFRAQAEEVVKELLKALGKARKSW